MLAHAFAWLKTMKNIRKLSSVQDAYTLHITLYHIRNKNTTSIDTLLFLKEVSDLEDWVSGKKLNATLTILIQSLIRP